ncbi:MAG: hypothetical protein LBK08_04530 [Treponema sp.]|jgi:hypothetical protein|nr:hypothetical protein [Treponema sp.]
MKNKSLLFFGRTLITGIALTLALAGCPAPVDSGYGGFVGFGNPLAEQLAQQLAADINAISAGSATVNGATVTLSGKLSLESQFIVPAGVTLDLTGDGELALLDAVLTVNGMVKAGTEKVRMRTAASWGAINGSGTIQLKGKGRLLDINDNRTLTLDGVTLAGVADNNVSLVGVNNGGEIVMKSGAITGNIHRNEGDTGGGVRVSNGGMFTMQGGAISGNTVQGEGGTGGGVHLSGGSTFTMKGGTISGNSAGNDGGGVCVGRDCLFTMEGGKITGNSARTAGGVKVDFPSVDPVENGGTFIMKGGAITGNSALGSSGGGVKVYGGAVGEGGTFIMEGGAITNNSTDGYHGGGGVSLTGGAATFIMKSGVISGNSASGGGGAEVHDGSAFTMQGGTISGNTGTHGGGGVDVRGGDATATFTMEGGAISGNSAGSSGGGVSVYIGGTFTMKGGTIYGKTGSLANIASNNVALEVSQNAVEAKWGTGGTYTKGGVGQTGGGDIGDTDDTLIAIPAP